MNLAFVTFVLDLDLDLLDLDFDLFLDLLCDLDSLDDRDLDLLLDLSFLLGDFSFLCSLESKKYEYTRNE